MTHIWIIGGFLGAGKTTLLMRLAGILTAAHPKGLAIVANDVSQIGVDQEVLRELYPNVYELFDGCVCCQLSASLVETVERIQSEIAPDIIIIEPSGIAETARITDTLRRYSKRLGLLRTLVVVDATRFDELLETLEPLVTAQVKAADVLAINKVDIADADSIARVRHTAAQLNPLAPILEISAVAPDHVSRVANEMMGFEGPTANGREIKFIAESPVTSERWEEVVVFLVSETVKEAAKMGATVIGHVKVFASGAEGLRIYCSSTGVQRPPKITKLANQASEPPIDGDSCTLTVNLNAIVYGLSRTELGRCVAQALSTTREHWKLRAEIKEPSEHEHPVRER
jgi:G3E family GTPase